MRAGTPALNSETGRLHVVPTFVSMLRGINVSGKKVVRMEELRETYGGLGLEGVRTYVQSGNVVFECVKTDAASLVRDIEGAIKERFGFEVPVLIRSREELQVLVSRMPFLGEDETKMHVTFLRDTPPELPTGEVDRVINGGERYAVSGREVYLFLPNGYGRTKLSNGFFERKFRTSATTRNWRTVKALLEMANA